jgi:hypothetical protein
MMHTLPCGQLQTAYLLGEIAVVIHNIVNIIVIVLNRLCKAHVRKYMNQ